MKEFTKSVLPSALLIAYTLGMLFDLFYRTKGDMTNFILGLILIMIYAKGE